MLRQKFYNKSFIKMNVFILTLKPILMLCKIVGIIKTSYYFESNGLLVKNTNSRYHSVFEFSKTVVLLLLTYYCHRKLEFMELFILYIFWAVIITSRISEKWIIKLINGIIKFDQKLTSLPIHLQAHQRQLKKQYWNIIFICATLYYIASTILYLYLWPIKIMNMTVVIIYFVRVGFIVEFTVIVSSHFYLQNLEYRFELLNDFWKCLPAGLLAVPGECSLHDIAMMVDNIRLLHAELSDILRIFSMGYGQILLGYFVFSYISMLICLFYTICFKFSISEENNPTMEKILKESAQFIYYLQNIIFTISIVTAASRVNDKKRQIISYLRLTRISNLSTALKIQIKMFMNQVSVFESDEMTAYGFFSINLNLIMSIIILIISGIATLIQMKEHPYIIQAINTTKNFYQHLNISM